MSGTNEEILRRFYDEVMTQGRYDKLSDYVCEDFTEENPDLIAAGQEQGIEGLRRWMEGTVGIWSDVRWIFDDVVADGDKVAVRFTVEGTQVGETMGIQPDPSRRLRGQACNFFHFRDGKIQSSWYLLDQYAFLRQVGALPASAEPMTYAK